MNFSDFIFMGALYKFLYIYGKDKSHDSTAVDEWRSKPGRSAMNANRLTLGRSGYPKPLAACQTIPMLGESESKAFPVVTLPWTWQVGLGQAP
jgi:hypothetical protein